MQIDLTQYELNGLSAIEAVQAIGTQIESAANQQGFAEEVIHTLTGEWRQFNNVASARMTAKYVVEAVVAVKPINFDEIDTKVNEYLSKNKFLLTETKSIYVPVAERVRLGTAAPTTKNGKQRGVKGGKQQRAIELYKANPTMSSIDFTHLLEKELGMTLSGARTYAYNCRKVWI